MYDQDHTQQLLLLRFDYSVYNGRFLTDVNGQHQPYLPQAGHIHNIVTYDKNSVHLRKLKIALLTLVLKSNSRMILSKKMQEVWPSKDTLMTIQITPKLRSSEYANIPDPFVDQKSQPQVARNKNLDAPLLEPSRHIPI